MLHRFSPLGSVLSTQGVVERFGTARMPGCYGFAIHLPCWWRISARVSAQLASMPRVERESAK